MNTQENIYQNILQENEFYESFFYSLQITFLSISISLVIYLGLFYLLLRLKIKYSIDIKSWLFFLQIPILIPYSLCAFLFFLLFFPVGYSQEFMPFLVGTSYAVVIAYIYKIVPFFILVSFPTLLKITKDEINLHKIYSNSTAHFFWKILVKRNLEVLFVAIFIVFAYIFNAYEIPSILGSNIDKMPSVLVYEKLGEFSLNSLQIAYAHSVLYFIITLLFIPLFYIMYTFFKRVIF
jgi:putative spermidine/putrescine transport system permease protein